MYQLSDLADLSPEQIAAIDRVVAPELAAFASADALPHDWKPRYYQQKAWDYLNGEGKRACLIWHRRSGKDDLALNWAAKAAHLRVGEYWHMLPEASQARKAIWDAVSPHTGVRRIDQAFPRELRANTRKNDMVIEFNNGSLWRVVGSDNYDSLLGSTPAGIVFSEWALADPNAWAFLRPILIENNGWALFITTPRGSNHAAKTLSLAKSDPEWFAQVLGTKDTNVFTDDQLAKELKEYQHDYGEEEGQALFEQEYNCSFQSALVGSYYGSHINRAQKDGRICSVLIDRTIPVHTAWDLGVSDSTGIWFIQRAGREYRLVDYHEAAGLGLDEYARILTERKAQHKWIYGRHYFPHDMGVRELSSGQSRADTMEALGYMPSIVPRSNVMDGINAVRRLIDQAYIDEQRCERGLNALRNYRREWDDRLKIFRDNPLHDWACVDGDTLVLTRHGTHPIKNLPYQGEVLTPCGWKAYRHPRVTRRNAPLVEVRFTDGLSVKCTAEHLFWTESEWKFAAYLQKGMTIRSSLTRSRSIGMAVCTAYGRAKDIIHAVASGSISMFGRQYLAPCQAGAISITETTTTSTTDLKIWNACQWANTYRSLGIEDWKREENTHLRKQPATPQQNGINQKRVGYGIAVTRKDKSPGKNGSEKIVHALNAARVFLVSFAKMVINKSFALNRVKPLIIESVKALPYCKDVWCLTVDHGGVWSLANGALTHNSHGADAVRTFACGYRDPKEKKKIHVPSIPRGGDSTSWMSQ